MLRIIVDAGLYLLFALMVIGGLTLLSPKKSEALFGWKTIEPDASYKVEASGFNLRVYEWTPKFNASITCLYVAGSETGNTVCYAKPEEKGN